MMFLFSDGFSSEILLFQSFFPSNLESQNSNSLKKKIFEMTKIS